ncbi:hypothetical protein Bhyg_12526 [Pseudolycoriella hygida]|uniref:Uncharacterized protein n=1 Tax=Pseudolycoriella hygida TaxID=35572 RepID=A0A9Q0MYF1_9DIPT|nr:hypothetical protein Bhyg_12526 [Pseudolycoriella hygida]
MNSPRLYNPNPKPQNAFNSFHPIGGGVAPSYHFHKSTTYVPLYIPSTHTYVHHYHHHNNPSTTPSNTTNYVPPPPPSEPVIYKDETADVSNPKMIVGFNNMIVYGVYQNSKHYVITISEDLDEDMDDIPEKFLHMEDTNLFEIVTLKPTTTTTTNAPVNTNTNVSTRDAVSGKGGEDVLNLHYGDIILR